MKKIYIVYGLMILLGLFIGATGTIAIVNHDAYYLGAALAGILFGIVGLSAMAWVYNIYVKDKDED